MVKLVLLQSAINGNREGSLVPVWDNILHSGEIQFILLRMALILLLTVLVAKLTKRIAVRKLNNKLHYRFLYNILSVLIYLIGIVTALSEIPNFNNAFATLLAGSGIAALSIGLAAQESLGNFINGLVISVSKPFEVGDRIRLINGNITGYIEDITMRHTVVRTFVNSRVIVPNSVINKDMIENSNFLEDRASSFIDVIITYDSDMERACEIMASVVESHPDFVDTRSPDQKNQPKVTVFVRHLSVYGVELRASMWTSSINNNFAACSEVRRQLKTAFDAVGIQLASGAVASLPPA